MIMGKLNISKFRLKRKEKNSKKTGAVEASGVTILAGARLSDTKRNRLATQPKRPPNKNKPAALPVI